MSGQWKPGDVALLTFKDGTEAVGVRHERGYWNHSGEWGSGSSYDEIGGHEARPLVVIDPEDAEAVERLWRAWTTLAPEHRLAQDNMQAALREFANPTPPRCEASVSIDTGDGFIGHWCRRDRGHAGPHESAAATWWDEVRP